MLKHLLTRHVLCKHCYKAGAEAGILQMNTAVITKHATSAGHLKRIKETEVVAQASSKSGVGSGGVGAGAGAGGVGAASAGAGGVGAAGAGAGGVGAAGARSSGVDRSGGAGVGAGRQLDLGEAGGVSYRSSQQRRAASLLLAVGSLVAGGGGAAAMPYSSIPATFCAPMLTVIEGMDSGFPSATTIREKVLPAVVALVKEYQDKAMKVRIVFCVVWDGRDMTTMSSLTLLTHNTHKRKPTII